MSDKHPEAGDLVDDRSAERIVSACGIGRIRRRG